MFFKVTFYWLIRKLLLSAFIPAPNFLKIPKNDREKNYPNLTRCYYDEFSGCPRQILSGRHKVCSRGLETKILIFRRAKFLQTHLVIDVLNY